MAQSRLGARRTGSLEEAIASFDRVLRLKPDSFKALDKKGYALVKLGRDREAIAQFDKALDIKPDYANAYYNKAVSYVLQGEVDPGLENL
ncbi:MAG: tetratricopeptide repeat protein, partial [Leptolyngbyaceae cyanobacterium RM2_2_4]|nr:tetratricopeptide repeat protein [Leptolyngbyaceae cyanobacterium RM2_2_4]